MAEPWTIAPEGLRLTIRLTPRAGRDAIQGVKTLSDGKPVLMIRVRAAPSEGDANAALVALVARELALPRTRVTLVAGATARLKTLALAGEPAMLEARLRQKLAQG